MSAGGGGRLERIAIAERWFADGFEVFQVPSALLVSQVDMTRAEAALEAWRAGGTRVTFTAIVVKAVAVALGRLPVVHVLAAGYRRLRPTHVDVGVSIKGETSFAPVVVLEAAEEKTVGELATLLEQRADEKRKEEAAALRNLSRFGWIFPFKWMRKLILRVLFRSVATRKKMVGTFQISNTTADLGAAMQFVSAMALGVGRVAPRVIAVDGAATVRSTLYLTLSADHRVIDGANMALFLGTLKEILEDAAELAPQPSLS